jgi:hypothetical protein
VVAQQGGDLVAVGGAQRRLVRAVLGQPGRADQSLADLMREDDPRQAQADQPGQGAERRGDERDQRDPLDGPLARSASATLGRS